MEENDVEMGPSGFAFEITRIAVAQICRSVGFRATQHSALEILTDVVARYLRALGESASSSATSSGRTQSNLYDIVRALEDLGSVQGFAGASNVNQVLLASSTLSDLQIFVKYTDEIPFAKPIPRRIRPKQSVPLPGARRNPASSVSFVHIPRWLPAIPDMVAADIDKGTQEDLRSGIGVDIDIGIGSDGGVEKKASELPEKRPRVRFKIGMGGVGSEMVFGVDLRSGVCRGGKRVSVQNRTDGGDDDGKKKNKCRRSKTKRRDQT